jgi:hypothetical protein
MAAWTHDRKGGFHMIRNTLLFLMASLLGGCSSGQAEDGGPSATGQGLCRGSCPKTCAGDADCNTADGQMCCDYGSYGKACVDASNCPRFCGGDSDCKTDKGETCCRPRLDVDDKLCLQPEKCMRFCDDNQDCRTDEGEQCCSVTKERFCSTSCPKGCNSSGDCDTGDNEVCCNTLKDPHKVLTVAGLCYRESEMSYSCPKKCTTSSNCDTAGGQLCCPDGYCADSCQKECSSNAQCDTSGGDFCCQAKALASPFWDW